MSHLSPKQRREIIQENILTHKYDKLAQLCGVTRRTIIRDVNKWRNEGGFEQFLLDEFFRSYPDIKKKFPDKAFDRICYLIGRTLTRKMELTEETREIKLLWIKDDSNPKDKVSTT